MPPRYSKPAKRWGFSCRSAAAWVSAKPAYCPWRKVTFATYALALSTARVPSNRYAEIGVRVRALCDKYDLPHTTGSLGRQYMHSFRTILKLALPNRFLKATADDAPETNSELKFRIRGGVREAMAVDPRTGRRRGLRTAMRELGSADVATA